jgi:hypothetical protein
MRILYKMRKTMKRSSKTKTRGSRKLRTKRLLKKLRKQTMRALPVVESGLQKVGKTVEIAAKNSAPIINKGVEGIYGTLATGFDMGVKGVKKGIKMRERSRSKSKSRK